MSCLRTQCSQPRDDIKMSPLRRFYSEPRLSPGDITKPKRERGGADTPQRRLQGGERRPRAPSPRHRKAARLSSVCPHPAHTIRRLLLLLSITPPPQQHLAAEPQHHGPPTPSTPKKTRSSPSSSPGGSQPPNHSVHVPGCRAPTDRPLLADDSATQLAQGTRLRPRMDPDWARGEPRSSPGRTQIGARASSSLSIVGTAWRLRSAPASHNSWPLRQELLQGRTPGPPLPPWHAPSPQPAPTSHSAPAPLPPRQAPPLLRAFRSCSGELLRLHAPMPHAPPRRRLPPRERNPSGARRPCPPPSTAGRGRHHRRRWRQRPGQ